jgi:hypothetical protein
MTNAKIGSGKEGTHMLGWKRFLDLIRTNFAGAENLALRACKDAVDETGGATLEMAISSSIISAMFFGVFQLSFASYTYTMFPTPLARVLGTRSCAVQLPASTRPTCQIAMRPTPKLGTT